MNKYKGISDYLKFITENYRLDIVINDFSGFLNVDNQLYEILQPYLIHKNSFCMHIKSNRQLWDRCLRMKRGILLKSERLKESYYGMCYCGVEEFIVPILSGDAVIGVICVGEFCRHHNVSIYRIKKIASQYGLSFEELEKKFRLSVCNNETDIELVKSLLGIVADYLSCFYASLAATHKSLKLMTGVHHSNEAYILSHAIEFIKQNFSENITVRDISKICHCSESCINHLFKKNMKVNIKYYINKLRIEQAKTYLANSSDSILEISIKVGFNDPNYFSNVFHKISNSTPSAFRRMFGSTSH